MRARRTRGRSLRAVLASSVVLAIGAPPWPARAIFPLPGLIPRPGLVAGGAGPAHPSPAPEGSPPAIVRWVDNTSMLIAFTFDACATRTQPNGFDRAVFRVLQREHVPATIFTSGRWVEFHPDAMRDLVADPLIEFANHSYDHPHMARLSPEQIGAEIDLTEAALGRYSRRSVAFRPPFGDFNNLVLGVVHGRGLPAVLWDVVSGDPSARATADAMIRSVVRQTRPGSIIIFHINARETKTADALPPIFRQLRARGFQFVHLSTLLASGTPNGRSESPAVAAAPLDEDGVMPLSAEDEEGADAGDARAPAAPAAPTPVPSPPPTAAPGSGGGHADHAWRPASVTLVRPTAAEQRTVVTSPPIQSGGPGPSSGARTLARCAPGAAAPCP